MENLKDYTPEKLSAIALNDLNSIQTNIAKAIELRKLADKKEWTDKLKELVNQSGFSLGELAGDLKSPKEDKKIKENKPPKYRNPEDHTQTWSGMGAKKKWLVAMLDKGRTLDEFLIK